MSRPKSLSLAAVIAASLCLSACDGGVFSGNVDDAPLDIQISHPSGVVLQVQSVRVSAERTAVDLLVLNGRDREIRLNQGRENSYIFTDKGEKLLLAAPAANANLSVPGTRSADMTLVFEGALSRRANATLVLNENGSSNSPNSSTPGFTISLALDGAAGSAPEQSTMSNLRPIPVSTLGLAGSQGSALGSGAGGGSNLQVVDALKSELDAVDTERGTIVSLPGDVIFDFNEASLRADANSTLNQLVELITASGEGQISIEGHTDSRGDDAYNQRLSLARAKAVKAYLVAAGVSADRLRTLGLGEARPVAPNAKPDGTDDEAGRQQNRRVEIILPGQRDDGAST